MDATVIEYRWLSGDEILSLVNPACAARGWAELNVNDAQPTCRVLGAWAGPKLVEFFAVQFYPVLGPLLRLDNVDVDSGETSRGLSRQMKDFLDSTNIRGYLTIADNEFVGRLCERFGMKKLTSPVYEFVQPSDPPKCVGVVNLATGGGV